MADKAEALFRRDLIFFEDIKTQKDLFRSVGEKLLKKKLVRPGYIEAIIDRENQFPTGLDLSVVYPGSLNVAIPHTETEFCNWKGIAVARLSEPIDFHNMIAPQKSIPVKFAFFILNNEKNSQTNLLSYLMDLLTSRVRISDLDKLGTQKDIYTFLMSQNGNVSGNTKSASDN